MATDLFQRFLNVSSTVEAVDVDGQGRIAAANGAFRHHVGLPADELIGSPLSGLLTAPDAERLAGWLADGPPAEPVRVNFVSASGSPFSLRCIVGGEDGLRIVGEPEVDGDRSAAEELMLLNNELATLARERARRERELEQTRAELETTLEELRTSYWHLQKIQEVLPLCMKCGRVKTAEAEWQPVVDYLKENEIFLSHGYCPNCAETVEREFGLEEQT
jgi:PAS domain-containing protein